MANITLGQTINESLSSTDTKNPKKLGSFSDDYTLSGFSNWQQVQVNLDSTAIDSYLQLVNASTGEVIADNDDLIQGNKNSQLKFTVVPGVNYAIRATSLNANETGNYTIKTSSLGIASSLVLIRGTGEVGTVDPLGRFVKIETFVEIIGLLGSFDIVLSNDNKILGFTSADDRNQLYSLDPGSDSSSLIGNFPVGVFMDALEFLPNGTLYGVTLSSRSGNNTELYTINPQNGTLSSIANFPMDGNPAVDMVFEPVNNRFLLVESRLFTSTLSSVSLTGQYTKIGDIGFNNVQGLSLEGSTLVGFTRDQKRIIIDPATGKGTFDRDITGITGGNGSGIIGAGSIPSATRTQAPPPPTPTPPTPTPPTSNSNNIQQPSTNNTSISITSASDVADGDQTLIPGGTIVVNGLATGINTGSSNLNDFLFDNLKVFLGNIPIPLTGISSTVGSNPVQFGTNITIPKNISPGNYPLKLVLNTGTSSSISGVGQTLRIIPANVTGAVTANFVDSITDQKLNVGIAKTISNNINGVTTISKLIGKVYEDAVSIANDRIYTLNEAPQKLPYGYVSDDLGIKYLPNDLGIKVPSQRNITLKFVPESSNEAKQTWIIIHGLNVDASDDTTNAGDFSDLGKAVAQANPGDRVLLLDWKEAAVGGKLNSKENGILPSIDALLRLGNYTAAKWIRPVAEWVVGKLKEEFGVDAEYASKNINLIGHSLGSLLSNEISRVWQEEQTKDKQGIDQNGKGIGVNTIFALDPPSQLNISGLSDGQPGFGYDVDGRTAVMDFISPESGSDQIYQPNFKEVSRFSRAFVGKNSLSGNQIFAGQADESFQMDFSYRFPPDTGQEHLWVIDAFKNLIVQKKELGDIGNLVNLNPILSDVLKGKEKAYDNRHAGILAFNTPNYPKNDLPANDAELPKPLFLTVKNKDGGNDDDIVYGTNGKDILQGSSLYSGAGNDIFYGKAENDSIFGGSGNDTINGDQGNDTIYGEQDNDTIFGSANNDLIWGGKGNDRIEGEGGDDTLNGDNNKDILIGGLGADILNGYEDDDILIGGADKDILTGGDGSDIFVFSPGDGATSINEVDIITDFGFGNFFGGGGVDKISLSGKLWENKDNIKFLPISRPSINTPRSGNLMPPVVETAMVLGTEYLVGFNRTFTNDEEQKIRDGFFQRI